MKMRESRSGPDPADGSAVLERGRELYEQNAWASAHEALSLADGRGTLGGDDLERLALAAYLIGRDEEYLVLLQRAYRAHVTGGADARAARVAFWLGLRLLFRGEPGQANGWFGRAQRQLEREPGERVELGYLMIATAQQQINAGDLEGASATAASAVQIGERFSEADLVTTARHLLGRIRLQQGKVKEGLSLLDDAMLSAMAGELSPLVTGLLYCSVIEGCQEVYALGRAREWTAVLGDFCDRQREMVAFKGICSVHRAEILRLQGAWAQALAEAEQAAVRCHGYNQRALGAAFYEQGEVRRLRGEFAAAEAAYSAASESGWEPQPGLSLLRLAQARVEAAAATIRRVVSATGDWSRRAGLLPAFAEIMLASGDAPGAEDACRELGRLADHFESAVLRAMAASVEGALQLSRGNWSIALEVLRRAWQAWQELDAPYMTARVRVNMGLCCRALGDLDGSRLELAAARAVFERLGATPDIAALDSVSSSPASPHALTARELEVLLLVAAGKTNKAIASALSLSEKTVERHVSNIFTKLDVPSRAAATAYAYQHGWITK